MQNHDWQTFNYSAYDCDGREVHSEQIVVSQGASYEDMVDEAHLDLQSYMLDAYDDEYKGQAVIDTVERISIFQHTSGEVIYDHTFGDPYTKSKPQVEADGLGRIFV